MAAREVYRHHGEVGVRERHVREVAVADEVLDEVDLGRDDAAEGRRHEEEGAEHPEDVGAFVPGQALEFGHAVPFGRAV